MVAIVGNRALDDPGAFGVEHNDALAVRDLGWLMTWVETAQEAFDTALIAYKVAEDRARHAALRDLHRRRLPDPLAAPGQDSAASRWSTSSCPRYDLGDRLFHPDNPITIAPQVDQDWLTEIRKQNDAAMRRAPEVIREAYSRVTTSLRPATRRTRSSRST